jgi:hypothetical protein
MYDISDNAYERFDFPTEGENVYCSRAAVDRPPTGRNGTICRLVITECGLGLQRVGNGCVKCAECRRRRRCCFVVYLYVIIVYLHYLLVVLQVAHPLPEMLGTRSVTVFEFFLILEYLHIIMK